MSDDTDTDLNGFTIKPGHTGTAGLPFGPYVWLLRRNDDKLYGVFTSRHEAVGRLATLGGQNNEWVEPVRVRSGSVRLEDVVVVNE